MAFFLRSATGAAALPTPLGLAALASGKDQRDRGRSTQYLEEMWLLDLCLSTDMLEPTTAEVKAGTLKPFRQSPWLRFAPTLKELGIDY